MPLPKSFSTTTTTSKEFELIEEGIYDAILEDVEYKGIVSTPWGDHDKIMFRFKIPEINRVIVQSVNNIWSAGGKYQPSSYYVIATAMGFPKVEESPSGEQMNSLIGQPIQLVIKKAKKEDGTDKNKISDFVAVNRPKTTKALEDEVNDGLGKGKK